MTHDSVLVKIEPHTEIYNITFTDMDNITEPVTNYLIPKSSLKPCHNYIVNFPLNCVDKFQTFTSDFGIRNVKDLVPFRNYMCSGSLHYKEDLKIESDPITFRIECALTNATKINKSSSSINVNWELSSSNCMNISTQTMWSTTCTSMTENPASHSGLCRGNHCDITDLTAYTNYSCNFKASFKGQQFRNFIISVTTLSTHALLPVEPISVDALLEVYKKKRADEGRLFMEEFQSVPRIYSNYSVKEAKKTENQPKNRYVDILPYDYNRVELAHGETDYINASFIEGYKETNKYIAAQGPKEETVGDFWTMIWEQKTSIIVMVTRCEEGNKNKCSQYWPSLERETEIYNDMVVKIKGEEKCPDYIIRHLTLINRKEKATEREVTHIQFTSWPDHGVPSDPGLLLKLRRRVNSFKNFFSGPIVVHCSAGVGRTGTYICIDAMIESLEAEGRVDIYGYVVKLRRQRCLMVQVEAQYVLIHTALIEYSQFGETEMALSDFHSELNTLRQKEGNDLSLMELEFQKLPKFKNYRSSTTAHTGENKGKNRSSIVPYDFNRVLIKLNDEASHDSDDEDEEEYSSDEEDEIPSKYINASYMDGYWLPSSFIVTQGPMANTVADFLHMLYQKKVKTVFMLTNCTENNKEFCSEYWDDEKKTFGEMVVKVNETEHTPTHIRRCLEIQHTKRKDSHTLQQYHFLKWAGQELPSNPLDLIDLMRSVRQSSDKSNKNKNLPILVHCSDGSTRSGIFCALWKLLDSADIEKLVDIFQVAKDLRKARMGIFNTYAQYEFLYDALEAAYPLQNGELKKPSGAPADLIQLINESTALISPSTDTGTEERTKETTDSIHPEDGATEANHEPEKPLGEKTSNGPTSVLEVQSV
ncbi:Receptor-type tyrosine-protein phosphatase C [Bagarius yarrelli]|uniref:Receptor-type tyrosine-protein phosphatase C n=1 Tax=Bagarius yarrelli TaxID=175774 RepID=A0A556V6D9_BAGYA|nr:Receptor-type tyrosine-protein phosphatase C [Bagarius yarrelli]